MSEEKTRVIDGVEYEEMGPYCDICGAHMGEYYDPKKGSFINPHNYDEYSSNVCPECGQEYSYEEGDMPILDDEMKALILAHNKAKLKGKE